MTPDIAYDNAGFIPGAAEYPPRWAARARAFREEMAEQATLGLEYGAGARNRFDLFHPAQPARGLLVFVHGGYWRRFDRSDWSHFAAGPLARGWAVAMPSYTLAPGTRIATISREVGAALAAAAGQVDGPVVVTGHSAGGHLSARMNCRDLDLPADLTRRLVRIVPISPLSDLRPFLETSLNADLRLDPAEAAAESPVLHADRLGIATTVWVGAEERPAFLDQARWLAEEWDEADLRIAPGRHHFDVIDGLEQADSPLVGTLLDGI